MPDPRDEKPREEAEASEVRYLRWGGEGGNSWLDAGNWSPQVVPLALSEVRFGKEPIEGAGRGQAR